MLISAEHQKLLEKYNNLVLRQYQFDEVVRKKVEQLSHQAGEITTLKNVFDQLAGSIKELSSKYEDILSELAKERKERERLSLIEHQYEQLKKLLYGRSSEKSNQVLPGQLLLNLDNHRTGKQRSSKSIVTNKSKSNCIHAACERYVHA